MTLPEQNLGAALTVPTCHPTIAGSGAEALGTLGSGLAPCQSMTHQAPADPMRRQDSPPSETAALDLPLECRCTMTACCHLPLATPDLTEVLRPSPRLLPVLHESPAETTPCGNGSASAMAARADHAGSAEQPRPSRNRHLPEQFSISNEAMGPWECAVQSFAIAWHVPPTRRRALRTAVDTPRSLDALVGELLAEASTLAFEARQPDFARWCYEFCEKAVARAGDRPSWRTIEPQPSLVEAVAVPAAKGLSSEALVWWCLDLRPLRDERISEARTT